jgi:hypothetical protein
VANDDRYPHIDSPAICFHDRDAHWLRIGKTQRHVGNLTPALQRSCIALNSTAACSVWTKLAMLLQWRDG